MKIGLIVDALDDSSAGISVYAENLVKNILKLDKKNEYVLIHHKKNNKKVFKKTKELIVPLKNIPFAREYRKIFQLPKILEKKRFDIIHETTQIGPFFRKTKFKKIVTIHDLTPLRFPKTQSWQTHLHHKVGLKKILRRVDKVIAVSKSTKKDILKFFNIKKSKINVIYEGYRKLEIGKNCLKKYKIQKPYLFYVGTLEPRKNIVNLIKGFKLSKINCQLIIGGKKGWKYQEIFEIVKKEKLQKRVKFIGFVDDEDIGYLYKNAIAFIFPSLYEGFGLPILEAMSCGCPVITSNVSSLPEVTGNAAILINPRNTQEISKAIIKIQNNNIRENLIAKGHKNIQRFNWENMSKETIKIYKDLKKSLEEI